jgi:hypothetical protein
VVVVEVVVVGVVPSCLLWGMQEILLLLWGMKESLHSKFMRN